MTSTATSARDRALQRAQRRVPLGGRARRDLAAPPDAGRVDEDDLAAAPRQPRVDGVARRARDLGDDRPLLAEQRVEQARLADVRPADERDRGGLGVRLGGHRRVPLRGLGVDRGEVDVAARRRPRRRRRPSSASSPTTNGSSRPAATSSAQASASASRALRASSRSLSGGSAQTIASSRSPVPRPCARRDRVGLLPAQRVELGGLELALLVVGLVDRDDDRRLRPPQDVRPPRCPPASGRSRRRPRRR